ncbi:hypothetical protein [Clostridium sp. Marseille-P2415]|uniref:hypothetical protein n=1 Tax=Clostridium sp. Marseille-P2415 TaxID=1805471 RepID=UPI00098848D5|nr:hypothetical protein [Clostridium sp. Marseille-P2415]
MYIKSVLAYRIYDTVSVLISADLPRPCDKARICCTYPGNIVYFRDPGKAQVFIEFSSSDEICPDVLWPWSSSVQLKDSAHDEVEIFVNRESIVSVPIFNYPKF